MKNSKCLKSLGFFAFLSLNDCNSHSFAAPPEFSRVRNQQAARNKIHDTAINIGEFKIQSPLGSGSHPFASSILQPPSLPSNPRVSQRNYNPSKAFSHLPFKTKPARCFNLAAGLEGRRGVEVGGGDSAQASGNPSAPSFFLFFFPSNFFSFFCVELCFVSATLVLLSK